MGRESEFMGMTDPERKVIWASSLGTALEWYDFYLYGSLAAVISKQFFSGVNETTAFIFALLAFAAGFAVRPFGALVFGRIGDLVGRKYTFLVTILIMGFSTAIVGVLPSYKAIGIAAPIILVLLRLLQGLALGGEYGGAATYVAEYSPQGKRGLFTSYIQTTASLGLFISLLVIMAAQQISGPGFEEWGWRLPFLFSIFLLAISVYIRSQLHESPAFQKMKDQGTRSKAPLSEAFGQWKNLKIVLMVLFGAVVGQAVVFYASQFYALFFLTKVLKVNSQIANYCVAGSLLLGTPFFVVMGWLSDKIGRKPIILAGCLLAALTYFPLFKALTEYANPAIFTAQSANPVTVVADPQNCSFQFDPIGSAKFLSSCDLAKSALAKAGISYTNEYAATGTLAQIKIGSSVVVPSIDGLSLSPDELKAKRKGLAEQLTAALKTAGYPEKADSSQINYLMVVLILTLMVIYVAMVYGPIAAYLVELFPTRIRYTSMSLPYHIGNGWFGGFLPTVAFAMVAAKGDIYFGLWYPVGFAAATFVIGLFILPETKSWSLDRHD
jgi:MFS family permease